MTPQDDSQEQLQFVTDAPDKNLVHELKKMGIEAGWLGQLFGSGKNAPINVAGLVIIFLVLAGIPSFFFGGITPASEVWKYLTPLITLCFGFMFGKGANST